MNTKSQSKSGAIKPKKTSELNLKGEKGGKLKSLDGKMELFGNPDKAIIKLARAHVDALEAKEDTNEAVKETKSSLHKALEKQRSKGKMNWVKTQSERRTYKFIANAKLELKVEKE